jgi:hypothetical protein
MVFTVEAVYPSIGTGVRYWYRPARRCCHCHVELLDGRPNAGFKRGRVEVTALHEAEDGQGTGHSKRLEHSAQGLILTGIVIGNGRLRAWVVGHHLRAAAQTRVMLPSLRTRDIVAAT